MSKTIYKLTSDNKYTVKGSGLIMDPDNSIRLDAIPKFYDYHRISDKNGVQLDEYNYIKLSSNMRHTGNLRNIVDGIKYRLIASPNKNLGLITSISNQYDITIKSTYDDEYGKESYTRHVVNTFSYITKYRNGSMSSRIVLDDYNSMDIILNFDVSSDDELGLGYTNTLVFTPESSDSVHTYTKSIEYGELDSGEPITISVMDGSKEKYHVEVVINSWKIRVMGHDGFMSFKDVNSDGYINIGGYIG